MREYRMKNWKTYFHQYLSHLFPAFLQEKSWNYKDDLCVIGAYDLYQATGDGSFVESLPSLAGYLLGTDGSIANWGKGEHNIDKISFGKSLWILYQLTGEEKYARAARMLYENLMDYPRTETGNFWHKDIYPHQVWLDGLYMGQPFYAACLARYQADAQWDDILDQFQAADQLLWEESLGLYLHACDCSRSMDWADKVTGKSPCVWLRAEGWYLMALCDVYEIAKGRTPRGEELALLLQKAISGILPYQQEETRMFLQIVDRADLKDNYSETSGSAMVAYALMKGSRLGMLPETDFARGREILEGIEKTYLKEEEDGYHLYGICASAGLGPGPDNRKDRTGKAEYYLSERQMRDNQHGAGATMMAVAECLRQG